MSQAPTYSDLLSGIDSVVPFIAPEALEASLGVKFRLRLGANESSFGPSPRAIAAMEDRLPLAYHYGDPQSHDLRQALSNRYRVDPASILVAGGIDELLCLYCRLFLNSGDEVVTTLGTYPTFEFAARGVGASIHRVPYREDRPDRAALGREANRLSARMVYLANPDNPSGWHESTDAVFTLLDSLPKGCVLLLDEAYAEYVMESPGTSIDPTAYPNLVRLRTFSKAYGLAGLRVGYSLSHPDHVSELDKIRLHFGVSSVAQAGALAALEDTSHLRDALEETIRQRARLREVAGRQGIPSIATHTNFVLFDFGTRAAADSILETLLRLGVFVRKPGAAPLDRMIRVTAGRADEVDLFETILSEAIPGSRVEPI